MGDRNRLQAPDFQNYMLSAVATTNRIMSDIVGVMV